jgi:hypothetical protein
MTKAVLFLPALVVAGVVAAENAERPNPNDPKAKVPPIEYRSAFEGYRPFSDQEAADWRKANEEVGAAGGHAGHRPGQGPGQGPGRPTSKPQPGQPDKEHGGHK